MANAAGFIIAALSAVVASAFAGAAVAYPDQTVTIVVPYVAGGPTDVAARLVAQELGTRLGQRFIVENRPGAGGNIGADFVARSRPDGATLLVIGAAHAINKTLYKSLPYDVENDLVPVSMLTGAPLVLVANPASSISSVPDLIRRGKQAGATLSYASQGIGTAPHLEMELLKSATGAQLAHVPYRGSAPALNDLVGGQIQVGFDSLVVARPFVAAGQLRALAVTGQARSKLLPDVATMGELGHPEISGTVWYGLMAPKGTPGAIVDKLHGEIAEILKSDSVRSTIDRLGAEPVIISQDDFKRFLASEVATWAEAVRVSGAKVD